MLEFFVPDGNVSAYARSTPRYREDQVLQTRARGDGFDGGGGGDGDGKKEDDSAFLREAYFRSVSGTLRATPVTDAMVMMFATGLPILSSLMRCFRWAG